MHVEGGEQRRHSITLTDPLSFQTQRNCETSTSTTADRHPWGCLSEKAPYGQSASLPAAYARRIWHRLFSFHRPTLKGGNQSFSGVQMGGFRFRSYRIGTVVGGVQMSDLASNTRGVRLALSILPHVHTTTSVSNDFVLALINRLPRLSTLDVYKG